MKPSFALSLDSRQARTPRQGFASPRKNRAPLTGPAALLKNLSETSAKEGQRSPSTVPSLTLAGTENGGRSPSVSRNGLGHVL